MAHFNGTSRLSLVAERGAVSWGTWFQRAAAAAGLLTLLSWTHWAAFTMGSRGEREAGFREADATIDQRGGMSPARKAAADALIRGLTSAKLPD